MATDHSKAAPRMHKSKSCEKRYLKVNEAYCRHRTKGAGCRTVPSIQMKGHWLQKAGFEVNTPIKVRVMDGCLVLTGER